jgi:hypothetical protein
MSCSETDAERATATSETGQSSRGQQPPGRLPRVRSDRGVSAVAERRGAALPLALARDEMEWNGWMDGWTLPLLFRWDVRRVVRLPPYRARDRKFAIALS